MASMGIVAGRGAHPNGIVQEEPREDREVSRRYWISLVLYQLQGGVGRERRCKNLRLLILKCPRMS